MSIASATHSAEVKARLTSESPIELWPNLREAAQLLGVSKATVSRYPAEASVRASEP